MVLSDRCGSERLCRETELDVVAITANYCKPILLLYDLCGSGGLMVLLIPLCLCLSEETLKAVNPNSCISSRLGCLEYNNLILET